MRLIIFAAMLLVVTANAYDVRRTGGTVYVCTDSSGEVEDSNHNEWQTLNECGEKADIFGREFVAVPGSTYVFTPDGQLGGVHLRIVSPTHYEDGEAIQQGDLSEIRIYEGGEIVLTVAGNAQNIFFRDERGKRRYTATVVAKGMESAPSNEFVITVE